METEFFFFFNSEENILMSEILSMLDALEPHLELKLKLKPIISSADQRNRILPKHVRALTNKCYS